MASVSNSQLNSEMVKMKASIADLSSVTEQSASKIVARADTLQIYVDASVAQLREERNGSESRVLNSVQVCSVFRSLVLSERVCMYLFRLASNQSTHSFA